MKCSNCNYESENDFMFCPNCGTAQTPAQGQINQQPEQPQQFTQQPPQQFQQQAGILTLMSLARTSTGSLF